MRLGSLFTADYSHPMCVSNYLVLQNLAAASVTKMYGTQVLIVCKGLSFVRETSDIQYQELTNKKPSSSTQFTMLMLSFKPISDERTHLISPIISLYLMDHCDNVIITQLPNIFSVKLCFPHFLANQHGNGLKRHVCHDWKRGST